MTPKLKNIIIFVGVAAALILAYIFFLKPSPDQGNLVSSPGTVLPNVNGVNTGTNIAGEASSAGGDFLALLLNIKTIKLDDSIFSDPAFIGLHDSSISLVPDGTEGRPNPFAQFGNDVSPVSTAITPPPVTPIIPTTPATTSSSKSSNTRPPIPPLPPTTQ